MRKTVHHYLVPHERNNFRSKLLHHTSLVILILFLFVTSISVNFVQRHNPEILGIAYSINQQELLDSTNRARAEQGLAPLSLNNSLSSAASGKAQHMFSNNYWAHFAPDGTSPWSFIKSAGYNYIFAGENLAKGFTDSQSIVNAWLNSPSHRENLLSDKYKEIGFAVAEGTIEGVETVLVVQMFGAQDVPVVVEQKVAAESQSNFESKDFALAPTVTPTISVIATPASSQAQIIETRIKELPNDDAQTLATVKSQKPDITPAFLNFSAQNNPLLNLATLTRALPIVITITLLLALIIDFVIVKKRNIPRIVGHNLDHIMILSMFLMLLVLQKFGSII